MPTANLTKKTFFTNYNKVSKNAKFHAVLQMLLGTEQQYMTIPELLQGR
jgi:hypothetical protein